MPELLQWLLAGALACAVLVLALVWINDAPEERAYWEATSPWFAARRLKRLQRQSRPRAPPGRRARDLADSRVRPLR